MQSVTVNVENVCGFKTKFVERVVNRIKNTSNGQTGYVSLKGVETRVNRPKRAKYWSVSTPALLLA